jgi:hypothetical protein
MAIDTQYRPLAGVRPTPVQPVDLSQGIARMDLAEVRARDSAQGLMQTFEQGLQVRQKVADDQLRTNMQRQLGPEATPQDVDLLNRYNAEIGGEVPMTLGAKGKMVVDIPAIRSLYGLKALAALEGDPDATDQRKLLFSEAVKQGLTGELYRDGKVISNEEIAAKLAALPSAMSAEQREINEKLLKLDERAERIRSVRGVLAKETAGDVVGPIGGRLGLWNQIRAALGSSVHLERLEDAAVMRQFIANDVRALVGDMKGAMNAQEVKLLFDSVPYMTDTVKVWQDYLDNVDRFLRKAADNMRAGIRHEYEPGFWESTVDDPLSEQILRDAQNQAAPKFNPQTVDLSKADQVPPAVGGYKNSMLMQGRIGHLKSAGKQVLYWPETGQYLDLGKESTAFFEWHRAAQQSLTHGKPPPPPPTRSQRTPPAPRPGVRGVQG